MDLKTLKKDHPDLVTELTNEVMATAKAKIDAAEQATADLQTRLDAATTANDEMTDRVAALEKNDAIRTENDIRNTQASIMKSKLDASSIPSYLHDKVSVNHEKFVKDGVFDKAGFTEAVETEVKDWEGKLETAEDTFIQGGGSSLRDVEDEHGTHSLKDEEDAAVNSMAKTLGLKDKEEK